MANKANKAATAAKRAAPAITTSGNTAVAKVATGTTAAVQAAPKAALFTMGNWPNVRANSIRHYAQCVAQQLTAANPNGFTLAAYRAALVANSAASTMLQPGGGWASHNMPTWCSHVNRGWLAPAT